jgi:hypothetical protein
MRIKADTKLVGWALLIVGLVLIVLTVYSMFTVFTGGIAPPAIFNMKSITIGMPTGEGTPPTEIELVQGDQVSKVVNMGLWTVLMLFVASAGSRIGGLGAKLIREIKVEVKRED